MKKTFNGKVYTLKARQHSKSSAQSYAKSQRKLGKGARVTVDQCNGHTNYNVWVR